MGMLLAVVPTTVAYGQEGGCYPICITPFEATPGRRPGKG
jgi:hypothetical protein